MKVRTFRAKSLTDALQLVRHELGPSARVLATEKKSGGIWGRLTGRQSVEVTALAAVASGAAKEAPQQGSIGLNELVSDALPVAMLDRPHSDSHVSNSQLPTERPSEAEIQPKIQPRLRAVEPDPSIEPIRQKETQQMAESEDSYRRKFRQFAQQEDAGSLLESMIEQHGQTRTSDSRIPSALFRLYTDLIDADVDDRFARELVDELQEHSTPAELADFKTMRDKATNLAVGRIRVAPEIGDYPNQRRIVALIGPTGVGKTTTIAKIAANLRLRDKRRVGLITVDTYRIAAVDQLRAYADIIDLPMEVVTTPREMREAVAKLADLDIVLIDTAGRTPRDELQIQELKAMLTEAQPDEVQLVLSSVCNARHLTRLVDQFMPVTPTSLLITKLDESMSFGHLLPLFCDARLPLSYTTHGQNVPDDIQPADPPKLVEAVMHFEDN